MRYLGLLAAIVVIVCVFAYLMREPSTISPSAELANSNSYGATVNAVRNTVHTAAGGEQRRKWAISQQMKTDGTEASVTYSTAGPNAEMLVAASDSMNSLLCSKIEGEVGDAAAAVGFSTISCRTTSGGIIVERELP